MEGGRVWKGVMVMVVAVVERRAYPIYLDALLVARPGIHPDHSMRLLPSTFPSNPTSKTQKRVSIEKGRQDIPTDLLRVIISLVIRYSFSASLLLLHLTSPLNAS